MLLWKPFKLKILVLSVVLLGMCMPNRGSADAAVFCTDLMRKVSVFLSQPVFKPAQIATTVDVVKTEDGYIFSRKPGKKWFSKYAEFIDDVQGDPTDIIKTTGRQLAKKLGFNLINNSTLVVPSAKKINSKLDQLNLTNEFKANPFVVRFYEALGISEGLTYLSKFGESALLPISTTGVARVHDYSYHVAYLLGTKATVQHLQYQIKLGVMFIEYLKNKKDVPQDAIDIITRRYAVHLDIMTGSYGYFYQEPANLLLAYTYSPFRLLQSLVPKHPGLDAHAKNFAVDYSHVGWAYQPFSEQEAISEAFTRIAQTANLPAH